MTEYNFGEDLEKCDDDFILFLKEAVDEEHNKRLAKNYLTTNNCARSL